MNEEAYSNESMDKEAVTRNSVAASGHMPPLGVHRLTPVYDTRCAAAT